MVSRKQTALAALVVFSIFAGCSPGNGDPVAALAPADRLFLFSNVDRGVAFLGQPAGAAELSCDADAMQQGYVFRYNATSKRATLDSLRPSGVETHAIGAIEVSDNTIDIHAKNGANLPFKLLLEREADDSVLISWDNAEPGRYLRCSMTG